MNIDKEIVINSYFNGDQVDGEDLWIFGYGSLVWKADFPYIKREIGCIKGFLRRFYQNSIDHRGTKTQPGRVCTLIPIDNDPNAKVWGMAYKISNIDKDTVLGHLDQREINGYTRHCIKFYPFNLNQNKLEKENRQLSSPRDIIIYVATTQNESYAGPATIKEIADQIYPAIGKSGPNKEYVYRLADSMRTLYPGQDDDHLFELERELRRIESQNAL